MLQTSVCGCAGVGLVVVLATLPGAAAGPEPRSGWDPKATQQYLDARARWWLDWASAARGQGTSCVSCHTTVPYAIALPALAKMSGAAGDSEAQKRLLASVRTRVERWDEIVSAAAKTKDPLIPFYGGTRRDAALDTESVLNALILVTHDPNAKGVLSERASQALDHMWARQQPGGRWRWLDFGLRPWEKDGDYHGATLAAVAAGAAGDRYPRHVDAAVKAKTAALRAYLKSQLAEKPFLHNRALGLWAASHLKGVFTDDEKKQLAADLFAIQRSDGGWSLADLGKKKTDGDDPGWPIQSAHPVGAVSDGYATGLVVLSLKRTGGLARDARLKKAVAWLLTRQAEDGTWPTVYINRQRDPNNDVGKFMREAGAAFAALALAEAN